MSLSQADYGLIRPFYVYTHTPTFPFCFGVITSGDTHAWSRTVNTLDDVPFLKVAQFCLLSGKGFHLGSCATGVTVSLTCAFTSTSLIELDTSCTTCRGVGCFDLPGHVVLNMSDL